MARRLLLPLMALLLTFSHTGDLAFSASAPDIGSHTDLNSFFFPSPKGFITSAKLASVQKPGFSPQALDSTKPSPVAAAAAAAIIYEHDGSPGSVVAAIQRALTAGFDIIKLDEPCSQVTGDPALAAAVSGARRGGTVVVCGAGPTLVFTNMLPGGVNVSLTLTNSGGQGGETYTSRVYDAASDLEIVVPGTLVFETANQTKSVNLTVFVKSGGGDGGRKGGYRWREAHIDWLSAGAAHSVIERALIIRQAI